MSQEELAEILNVTRQTISNWENAKSYPDIETLVKISEKFNVSLDILLKNDKHMIETIDKKVKDNQKLRKVIIILSIFLLLFLVGFFINWRIEQKRKKEEETRYQEMSENLNTLEFHQKNDLGFRQIIEGDAAYKVYAKKEKHLTPQISAMVHLEDGTILADYNGKRVVVTYAVDKVLTIYLDVKGNLENTKQNKNNTKYYHQYQQETVQVVKRMVELFHEIYK